MKQGLVNGMLNQACIDWRWQETRPMSNTSPHKYIVLWLLNCSKGEEGNQSKVMLRNILNNGSSRRVLMNGAPVIYVALEQVTSNSWHLKIAKKRSCVALGSTILSGTSKRKRLYNASQLSVEKVTTVHG